jgi:hypothetical protein
MRYNLIETGDEVIVITSDGGVACIRQAEPFDDTPRVATTDYYQTRLTDIPLVDDVWTELAEGKMYAEDWETREFNDLALVFDALQWLGVGETDWLLVKEPLFPHIEL